MSAQPAGAGADLPRWREMFTGRLGRITVGIVLMETLFAVQTLVTITVLPAVVADLGGIRLYGVGLSASVLAGAVALPVAAKIAYRFGALATFAWSVVVFAIGTCVVITATAMPVFILGRLVEGAGGGAQYAVALAVVTRVYSKSQRPRLLALWTAAWALPGLLGPSYGGLVASTLGWRWAFGLLLPVLLVAALLLAPALTGGAASEPGPAQPALAQQPGVAARWLVGLGLGAAAVLVAIAAASTWAVPLGAAGLVVSVMAVRAILPSGSFRARPGLPSTVAVAFLATTAFFAADGFLPVILTRLRGQSLTVASLVITGATLAWVAGSFLQARLVTRVPRRHLVSGGAVLVVAGVIGVAAGALGGPLAVPYVAWTVAGFGMGVAYPTITLVAMEAAPTDSEGQTVETLAQYQLADALGSAVGPGLSGGVLSVALTLGTTLQTGLVAGLGLALAVALLLLSTSVLRFDRSPGRAG
jgi:MFS family permease